MSKISSISLLFVIATIPLLFGAVQPWVWSVYAGMILIIFLIELWRDQLDLFFFKRSLFILFVGSFFVYTLFLCLPLPPSIVAVLSPHRYQLLKAQSEILNSALSWQPLAYSTMIAFSRWILIVGFCLFAAMLYQHLQNRIFMNQVIWIMLGVAFIESMYGLIQVLVTNVGVLWVENIECLDCAQGTYINRNHFAGFLEMIWPIGLGFIFFIGAQKRRKMSKRYPRKQFKQFLEADWFSKQIFMIFLMVLVTLSLLFSKSRAGITGWLLGVGMFILLLHLGKRRMGRMAWAMAAVSAAILAVYCSAIGFEAIIERFLRLSERIGRITLWELSFEIVKDHPMGIGLNNFATVFPVYDSFNGIYTKYLYAHNDYLQLLIECGWPGFFLLISGFYFFLGKSIVNIIKYGRRIDDFHFFIGIGALSGLVSMAFHSFFDFNLRIPSNLLYFVILMVLVYVCLGKNKEGVKF